MLTTYKSKSTMKLLKGGGGSLFPPLNEKTFKMLHLIFCRINNNNKKPSLTVELFRQKNLPSQTFCNGTELELDAIKFDRTIAQTQI